MNMQDVTRNQIALSKKLVEFANINKNADVSSSFDNFQNWIESLNTQEFVVLKGIMEGLTNKRLLNE